MVKKCAIFSVLTLLNSFVLAKDTAFFLVDKQAVMGKSQYYRDLTNAITSKEMDLQKDSEKYQSLRLDVSKQAEKALQELNNSIKNSGEIALIGEKDPRIELAVKSHKEALEQKERELRNKKTEIDVLALKCQSQFDSLFNEACSELFPDGIVLEKISTSVLFVGKSVSDHSSLVSTKIDELAEKKDKNALNSLFAESSAKSKPVVIASNQSKIAVEETVTA